MEKPVMKPEQMRKILAEIMDRVDNCLCNVSSKDMRFVQLLALSEEIDKVAGELGIWWKRYTPPEKTHERKVRYNLERIRELINRLPGELAEKIKRGLDL